MKQICSSAWDKSSMELIKNLKYNEEMECAVVWYIDGNAILVEINVLIITNIGSTCNLVDRSHFVTGVHCYFLACFNTEVYLMKI